MSDPDPPAPPKPEPRTASDWHELAARLEAECRFHELMLSQLRARAENARARAEAMESGRGPLRIRVDSDTVNAMNASISSDALRSATQSAYKDNAFVEAKRVNGETISDVVALLDKHFKPRRFHQNVVQGWYVPVGKKSHRDCPIEVREYLREHYGKFTSGPHKGAYRVPLDSWPLERGR